MSYAGALTIVIVCAAAAGVAALFVDWVLTKETRRNHHEVGGAVFQQVGVMFSVLLAFVFSDAWQEHNTAAQAVNGECGALHGAAMLANALPHHIGRPVNIAIAAYDRTVVTVEWPMLARGKRSPQAAEAFRIAMDTAARLPVTERADVAMRSQILSLMTQAHTDRETRTFEASRGLPAPVWWVLIAMAGVLTTFVVLAGVDRLGHVLFAAAFAACAVGVLVLVRMLEFPFQGSLAVSSADFTKLLGEVTAMLAMP
jgi:hypothetical protein